jgi:phospholipase/carboxylesterase
MTWTTNAPPPHGGQPIVVHGTPLDRATSAMVLIHGRGASADDILPLGDQAPHAGMVYVAPDAAGRTWYPNRFIAPIESNEPWLSSALAAIDGIVTALGEKGIGADRIVLAGFSQGGCLALEFAARNPRRYGGLVGLSAGLIGPPGTKWPAQGSLGGTPVFLGCSDVDAHIPKVRVEESMAALEAMGGDVVGVIYPGMGHTVIADELRHVQRIVDRLP